MTRTSTRWESSASSAENDPALAAHELEVRRQMPPGDVDVRARSGHRLGDGRHRLGAVDEHVELVARPRRRIAGGPQLTAVGVDGVTLTEPTQAPAVVLAHAELDPAAEQTVDGCERVERHALTVPAALRRQSSYEHVRRR